MVASAAASAALPTGASTRGAAAAGQLRAAPAPEQLRQTPGVSLQSQSRHERLLAGTAAAHTASLLTFSRAPDVAARAWAWTAALAAAAAAVRASKRADRACWSVRAARSTGSSRASVPRARGSLDIHATFRLCLRLFTNRLQFVEVQTSPGCWRTRGSCGRWLAARGRRARPA